MNKISRLKKINRSLDICDRDLAICYINGEIIEGNTHAGCINKYLEKKQQESLNNSYGRPIAFDDYYDPEETELSYNDQKDMELIKSNIKQMAFAHLIRDDNSIYIESDTLYNVDLNTVAKTIKEIYPSYEIHEDDNNNSYPIINIARLKKLNKNHDVDCRDSALVYIDGEIIEDYTHAGCINDYLKNHVNQELYDTFARPYKCDPDLFKGYKIKEVDKQDMDLIENNIKEMAFAHKVNSDNAIYIENDSLQNLDMYAAAEIFKDKYPSYSIYIDETDERVAKLINSKFNKLQKTASQLSNDFDSFVLDSGDVIGLGCRLVNNKPWYQVYQEGLYITSSYYDGPDYDRAMQIYKDLMTAFNGVGNTESFSNSEAKIKESIESLINEKEKDDYNFQRLKSDPLFLGVNRNDW